MKEIIYWQFDFGLSFFIMIINFIDIATFKNKVLWQTEQGKSNTQAKWDEVKKKIKMKLKQGDQKI